MNARKSAITLISNKTKGKKPCKCEAIPYDVDTEFGCDTFGLKALQQRLSRPVYTKLLETINEGLPLDKSMADDVAHGMKRWAMERGATHYTHWFFPLTGASAEKHDSFIQPDGNGGAIARFSGENLIIGEPDASSFPSGGLRSTFEARGYTAWDPTSPAFIKRSGGVATLCIPTVFCSYTGEVLDRKTPLLRSVQVLGTQAKRLLKCFGVDVKNIVPRVTLGAEQEYFLIDKHLYMQRPDIMQTGRTLFGAPPQKHQQLEDHYFGSIKPRVLAFMDEVDRELWRMGVPAKTRHNEVAPAQFELAPVFEELNLATDHNMLLMETLKIVAERHGLICLLHEKPFAGVNGSGKHNNWSISVGNVNLLNPGKSPHENAIFLTALCAIIQAVDRHSELLRSATAGIGNDLRLGANEAPPSVVSIFLGDQLSDIIDQIEHGGAKSSRGGKILKIGVDALPPLTCDVADRNRTSPFAFTGNKFEFRMAGSSQSCSTPNVILNTIVAEAFDEIASKLEKLSKNDFQGGLQKILQNIIKTHKRILFNGDGYDNAWLNEAKKRGLPNLKTTPEAIKPLIKDDNRRLFAKYGVFTECEMNSRYEVYLLEYNKRAHIETSLTLNMARTMILPSCVEYLKTLLGTLSELKSAKLPENRGLKSRAKRISALIDSLEKACENLESKIEKTSSFPEKIKAMEKVREIADLLELEVDDSLWKLPKYSELLFVY